MNSLRTLLFIVIIHCLAFRDPVDVDVALAVEEGDHYQLFHGHALSDLLGSWVATMFLLVTLSLGLRIVRVDSTLVTSH